MTNMVGLRRARPFVRGLFGAISGRGVPLHRSEGFRPFFVVGSGRSGTTLLRRLLVSEHTHIGPEMWSTGPVIVEFLRWGWLTSWQVFVKYATASLLEDSECKDDFKREVLSIAGSLSNAPRSERSVAYLLHRIHQEQATWVGSRAGRWGDKTPYNTFFLPELKMVFPDAAFIHLVRDGVDVIVSYVETGLQPSLDAAATRWTASTSSAMIFARKYPCRCLESRYEDLVTNTEGVVERISDFLELPSPTSSPVGRTPMGLGDLKQHSHHQRVFEPIDSGQIGKGRAKLTSDERHRLAPRMNPLLIRLGYPPL